MPFPRENEAARTAQRGANSGVAVDSSRSTSGRSDCNVVPSGSTIGILGGGQLGRMMALSARAMGFRVAVLDPTPDSPCGQVADREITAPYSDRRCGQQVGEHQ